jgi:hypothetical protein
MSNLNGLLAPQATHGNPEVSYYLQKGEPIPGPILIDPVSILAQDASTNANLYVNGADAGGYMGALVLTPGDNLSSVLGPGNGLTIRTTPGSGGAPATTVEVGANAQGPNRLYIAGLSGVGEVYDEVYNPVIVPTPLVQYTGAIPANTGPGLWTFTPTRTGAYMLQVNFNIANGDNIPVNGAIEWTLNVAGGEVQYVSNTIKSTSISKASDFNEIDGLPGTLAPPMDYSFSDMAILTAGQQVSFYLSCARNSAAGGLAWSVANYQVRLVQMC